LEQPDQDAVDNTIKTGQPKKHREAKKPREKGEQTEQTIIHKLGRTSLCIVWPVWRETDSIILS